MRDTISISFLILALLAEIIGTIGGFGSSVFFVPIANFYFDFESVLGLTAIFHVASNLSKIAQFKKGINKSLILNLGIPAIGFVIIGGLLSKSINGYFLEIMLGVFLIILSSVFLINKNLKIKQGKAQAIAGGVVSGFLAGLLGTGGAVRGLTMIAFNLEKSVFIATSAAIDFGVDLTRTIVYAYNGYIHWEDMIYVPFLILIGWFGTKIGKRILNYIPQDRFKNYSLYLILAIGIITVLRIFYK